MPHIATDVTVASGYVCMSLSSVTLVHPAKAVGWNEMPFGRDTRVVASNTVLDGGPSPHGKGRFGGRNPETVTDSGMVTMDSL